MEEQVFQDVGLSQQSLQQDPKGKTDGWRMEENASKPTTQAASSQKSAQSVELKARDSSRRHPAIAQHSLSDPSINVHSGYSSKFSSLASEHSKVSSKRLPYTASLAARGDHSMHQTEPPGNDSVGSDSDIQESIHSVGSLWRHHSYKMVRLLCGFLERNMWFKSYVSIEPHLLCLFARTTWEAFTRIEDFEFL